MTVLTVYKRYLYILGIRRGTLGVISVSALKELIANKTLQTNGRTDIWTRFGTTLAQIPVAFPEISGSESKSHW